MGERFGVDDEVVEKVVSEPRPAREPGDDGPQELDVVRAKGLLQHAG